MPGRSGATARCPGPARGAGRGRPSRNGHRQCPRPGGRPPPRCGHTGSAALLHHRLLAPGRRARWRDLTARRRRPTPLRAGASQGAAVRSGAGRPVRHRCGAGQAHGVDVLRRPPVPPGSCLLHRGPRTRQGCGRPAVHGQRPRLHEPEGHVPGTAGRRPRSGFGGPGPGPVRGRNDAQGSGHARHAGGVRPCGPRRPGGDPPLPRGGAHVLRPDRHRRSRPGLGGVLRRDETRRRHRYRTRQARRRGTRRASHHRRPRS